MTDTIILFNDLDFMEAGNPFSNGNMTNRKKPVLYAFTISDFLNFFFDDFPGNMGSDLPYDFSD